MSEWEDRIKSDKQLEAFIYPAGRKYVKDYLRQKEKEIRKEAYEEGYKKAQVEKWKEYKEWVRERNAAWAAELLVNHNNLTFEGFMDWLDGKEDK